MSTTTRLFNGSIFNFAGTPVLRLAGMSYKQGGNWIEVTQPTDVTKIFEIGQPDLAVTLKFKGHNGLTEKEKGDASITWADGTNVTLPGSWMVGPIEDSGDWDAPITGTAELRPTVPDAS